MFKTFIFSVVVFLSVLELTCQTSHIIDLPSSEMTIDGTSTVHDWTSIVEVIEGSVQIDAKDGKILSVKELNLSIPVKSIKSGKNAMDKNTYKAMKESAHKFILFKLSGVESGHESLEYWGNLTIAGVSKEIRGSLKYIQSNGSGFAFKGEVSLKMSEYGIDPPKAVMGTIKTGDEIIIKFNLQFKNQ